MAIVDGNHVRVAGAGRIAQSPLHVPIKIGAQQVASPSAPFQARNIRLPSVTQADGVPWSPPQCSSARSPRERLARSLAQPRKRQVERRMCDGLPAIAPAEPVRRECDGSALSAHPTRRSVPSGAEIGGQQLTHHDALLVDQVERDEAILGHRKVDRLKARPLELLDHAGPIHGWHPVAQRRRKRPPIRQADRRGFDLALRLQVGCPTGRIP